jgi:GH25 family lysozyme M1 (1,4-beta-N-acetylmuramidase)
MTVKGVDVASYQSSKFSTKGLDFAFVKATEGTSYINPRMAAQASHARAAGLVVGFYHFLRPGEIKAQARYFVEECVSVEGDPLFADWEDSGVSCAAKDSFLAEVNRLRGSTHRVGLYCNRDFWLNRDTTSEAGDALWIADYVTAGKPRISAKWKFHQYTDSPLDTNVGTFADREALRKWADG